MDIPIPIASATQLAFRDDLITKFSLPGSLYDIEPVPRRLLTRTDEGLRSIRNAEDRLYLAMMLDRPLPAGDNRLSGCPSRWLAQQALMIGSDRVQGEEQYALSK